VIELFLAAGRASSGSPSMKRPWFDLSPAGESFLSSAPECMVDTMEIGHEAPHPI
jgi:hypothetical protein